jgi:hypothetical protein
MNKIIGTFPFGQPVRKVCQTDRTKKIVFVLGVYASAVYARWIDEQKSTIIRALAVDSEPEIFWNGEGADEIIKNIEIRPEVGRLVPAASSLKGPSGKALDNCFLKPLGFKDRSDVWLCDLIPYSCQNPRQNYALAREYDPKIKSLGLPMYQWPKVPDQLADEKRINEILEEFDTASPELLITLGDQPLKWFASRYGSQARLTYYGDTQGSYGRLHDFTVEGRKIKLLPLVHPRQAGALGNHSKKWFDLHDHWMINVAPGIMKQIQL